MRMENGWKNGNGCKAFQDICGWSKRVLGTVHGEVRLGNGLWDTFVFPTRIEAFPHVKLSLSALLSPPLSLSCLGLFITVSAMKWFTMFSTWWGTSLHDNIMHALVCNAWNTDKVGHDITPVRSVCPHESPRGRWMVDGGRMCAVKWNMRAWNKNARGEIPPCPFLPHMEFWWMNRLPGHLSMKTCHGYICFSLFLQPKLVRGCLYVEKQRAYLRWVSWQLVTDFTSWITSWQPIPKCGSFK